RPFRAAAHGQAADGDSHDVSVSGFRGIHAMLTSRVQDGESRHSEVAAADAVRAGVYLLLEDWEAIGSYGEEADSSQKRERYIGVRVYVARPCGGEILG